MSHLLSLLLFVSVVLLSSCTKTKRNLAGKAPHVMPPLKVEGTAYTAADERPIQQTEKGFVHVQIPGVVHPEKTHTYTTYIGPSN